MNNILTASRMGALLRCPRSHFWRYEVGLQRDSVGFALIFGGAWARAMEARWLGKGYGAALRAAVPAGTPLDEYAIATLSAILAAYYDHYGKTETVGKLYPETPFASDLEGMEGWTTQGVMDGLGTLKNGRQVIVEAKTTGDPIDPSSDYWLRLRFNMQVLNYVTESRKMGWDVAEAFYDVTRKPSIKPKVVDELDRKGRKIVVDRNGERVVNEKGKNAGEPRQSGDAARGWTVKSHVETPEEYGKRLYLDVMSRPDFYFCRKPIPIIDQEVEKFEKQRLAIARMIEHFRANESDDVIRDPEAWPRNVSCDTCDFCQFKNFCLNGETIDQNNPPPGYSIAALNPELDRHDTTEKTDPAAA